MTIHSNLMTSNKKFFQKAEIITLSDPIRGIPPTPA